MVNVNNFNILKRQSICIIRPNFLVVKLKFLEYLGLTQEIKLFPYTLSTVKHRNQLLYCITILTPIYKPFLVVYVHSMQNRPL